MQKLNPETTERTLAFPLFQLDAGEITNLPAAVIGATAASNTSNVIFSDGRVRPRPGLSLHPLSPSVAGGYSPTSSITHLGKFITTSQVNYTMRLQLDSTTGWTSVWAKTDTTEWEILVTSPLGHINTSPPMSAMFNEGEWLLVNGTDNLQMWNGTSTFLVDVTNTQSNISLRAPAQPAFICTTGSRVFLGNAVDQNSGLRVPYRVWWSDTGDSTKWSNGAGLPAQGSAGYQDLFQGADASPITGMYFQGETIVIVFKKHSVYRGVFINGGPVWYNFLPITQSRGCVAPGSIRAFNDTLIWLGDDYNVYSLSMGGQVSNLGDAIRPRIQQLVNLSDAVALGKVSAVVDTVLGLYWLMLPSAADNSTVILCCNLHTGAWSEGHVGGAAIQPLCGLWVYPESSVISFTGISRPTAIWGCSDGRIYALDHTKPQMIDYTVPWDAYWWGRTQDFMQIMQLGYAGKLPMQVHGETGEWHKISLHGTVGEAIPRVRMGKSLNDLVNNKHLYTFECIDADNNTPAYSASVRADAERFSQLGVYWPPGTASPMAVDGITVWGMSRQVAR